jgi:hypothetical protein
VGRISTVPADEAAWNVLRAQIAISRHLSQSLGGDLSGQQGMSADMEAMSIEAIAIDDESAAPAAKGTVAGAVTKPAIKKTASSRQR